jgi:hypothetical protein
MQDTNILKSFLNEEQHVETIGTMVEDTENSLRNTIEEIYVKKSKEVRHIKL